MQNSWPVQPSNVHCHTQCSPAVPTSILGRDGQQEHLIQEGLEKWIWNELQVLCALSAVTATFGWLHMVPLLLLGLHLRPL